MEGGGENPIAKFPVKAGGGLKELFSQGIEPKGLTGHFKYLRFSFQPFKKTYLQ